MPTFLRVRAVEGRLLPHPLSFGLPQLQFVGCTSQVVGEKRNSLTGQMEPVRKHLPSGDVANVPEPFAEHYFRKAILDGGLEYMEHISDPETPEQKTWVDASLAAATAKHKAVRSIAPPPTDDHS